MSALQSFARRALIAYTSCSSCAHCVHRLSRTLFVAHTVCHALFAARAVCRARCLRLIIFRFRIARERLHIRQPLPFNFFVCAFARECLCALDLASLHALRANVGLADMTLGILNRHLLDVGTEYAVGNAVGMADVSTGNRGLAADFTYLGHVYQLQ